MIEVNNISKKYGNHYAVKDLTFTIEKGKVYGFLGPNGAGKSTTMNIITGYLAATSGTVTVDGHDILKEAEEAKKCIGYLPEIPPLYPEMTVYEYLSFVAELKRVDKKDRKNEIDKVMEKTMITDMKDRMIKNLSKGYKQRVGLAQAIIGYPDVIILDEPTVGLDPKQILEIRELIADLKKEHTIILSSHILSEVSAVCDVIMIISKGKLIASDTVDNLNKMMSGESHIELNVRGAFDDVEAVLDETEGIITYRLKENANENMIEADIEVNKNCDIREFLSLKLAERNIPVYKLLMTSKSLEEIFLELTEEDENKAAEGESDSVKDENESSGEDNDETCKASEDVAESEDTQSIDGVNSQADDMKAENDNKEEVETNGSDL